MRSGTGRFSQVTQSAISRSLFISLTFYVPPPKVKGNILVSVRIP